MEVYEINTKLCAAMNTWHKIQPYRYAGTVKINLVCNIFQGFIKGPFFNAKWKRKNIISGVHVFNVQAYMGDSYETWHFLNENLLKLTMLKNPYVKIFEFNLFLTVWGMFIIKIEIIILKQHYPGIWAIILVCTGIQMPWQWLPAKSSSNKLIYVLYSSFLDLACFTLYNGTLFS